MTVEPECSISMACCEKNARMISTLAMIEA